MRRMGLDDKQLKPRIILGKISWAKNHMIDPQEYFLNSANPQDEKIAHIFEAYRKELAKANALDFDDLLLETVRLLKSSGEVREKYNRRYKYLLIDEYQDTNRPQYELMKLLSGSHHNVCVVGDEDQSIYSWRGADIKNILEFEKDFPEVKTIRLEQNYRSTEVILEGASAVVRNNTQRKGKELWTAREGGSKIGYYEAPDGENEALFVADRIATYLREAGATQEAPRCAVLYRTNSQSRLVEEALRRYNIQYTMVGGFSFYDRARDQGHAQLSQAGAEPERLRRACAFHQHPGTRHRQDHAGDRRAHRPRDRYEYVGRSEARHRRPPASAACSHRAGRIRATDHGRPRASGSRLRGDTACRYRCTGASRTGRAP